MRFIAEISCSHMGDLAELETLINQAKIAGATDVKMQFWLHAEKMVHPMDSSISQKWGRVYDLYEKIRTPIEFICKGQRIAKNLGLSFGVSVYDVDSFQYLTAVLPDQPDFYKISGYESGLKHFVNYVVDRSPSEVVISFRSLSDRMKYAFSKDVITLLATSYNQELPNLNDETFSHFRGISDHTNTPYFSQYCASVGARVFEAHIYNRIDSPDRSFSMKVNEFENYIHNIKIVGMHYRPPVNFEIRQQLIALGEIEAGELLILGVNCDYRRTSQEAEFLDFESGMTTAVAHEPGEVIKLW